METLIFILFAALAVGSGIVVVVHRSPFYATLSLVLTLFSMAALFILLGAPFVGALQILVYAGAIVVLFLFVIMLLNVQQEETAHSRRSVQLVMAILGAIVFLGLFWLAYRQTTLGAAAPLSAELVSLQGLAGALFTDYLLPFEIVGLLLLVAVIGATVAARRPDTESSRPEDDYVSGDEPRTDPVLSGPDPRRASVAEPAYQSQSTQHREAHS
jgi:NADH-quinone oxidoreductase subunit J